MREFDVILNDNYTECDVFIQGLLYLDFCTFKAKLVLEQQDMLATVKKIATIEPVSLAIKVPKNGLAVHKLIEGTSVLFTGDVRRRAKLDDYRNWTLQSMSSRTLKELAYIHPRLSAKMRLETKVRKLNIRALKADLTVK